MKKMLILMIILVMVCGAGMAFATSGINAEKEQVHFKQNILVGNGSQIEGLSVSYWMDMMEETVFWDICTRLGAEPETETDFYFSRNGMYEDENYRNIDLWFDVAAYLSVVQGDGAESSDELKKVIDDFGKSMENGTEKTFTVDISKYLEYYPIGGSFDLESEGVYWDGGHNWAVPKFDNLVQQFRDFFKFPVIDGHEMEFCIEKDLEGNSYISSVGSVSEGVNPSLWTEHVMTEDACYFTFTFALDDESSMLDFSQVPGGYGIYRLRFEIDDKGVVSIDEKGPENVFHLNQSEFLWHMGMDEEEEVLYLVTVDSRTETVWLYVINLEDMSLIQKEDIYHGKNGDTWVNEVFIYEEFIVVDLYDGFVESDISDDGETEREPEEYILLLTKDEQGIYKIEMEVPAFHKEHRRIYYNIEGVEYWDQYFYISEACSWDWNGKHLAVAENITKETRFGDGVNFNVAVYDESGLIHYSEYISSLDTGYNPDDYYHSGDAKYKSIKVCWEN